MTKPMNHQSTWFHWLGWALAGLVCLAVFGMYSVPDFMVMLADQVWSCF